MHGHQNVKNVLSYHDNPVIRLIIFSFVILSVFFVTGSGFLVVVYFYLVGCKSGLVGTCVSAWSYEII